MGSTTSRARSSVTRRLEEGDVARIQQRASATEEEPFVVAPAKFAGVAPRTRVRVTWGCGGLLLGVAVAMLGLIFFTPRAGFTPAGPPPQSDISIGVDDRYLTRLVSEGVAKAQLPFVVRDVRAHAAPGNIVIITGQVEIAGVASAELTAQAQAYALGGTIALRNLSGSMGGVTLAGGATDVLQSAINARIAAERELLTQGGIHYSVVGVSSGDGVLTLHLTFA